jgi:N-acetylglucosamine malate deacetylase 1
MTERSPLPVALSHPPRGRVLVIAPHPDDDVIGVGGTASLHAEQGDLVTVLILGDGQAGDVEQRHDPEAYTELRRAEARAGGAHLGLTDYEFWHLPEGHAISPEELGLAAKALAAHIGELGARIVYAPWVGEQHIDHHFVGRLVQISLAVAHFEGEAWGYEVWTPLVAEVVVDITSRYESKVAALREHATQLEHVDIIHKGLAVSAQRSIYLPGDARHGEAFAKLGGVRPEDQAVVDAVERELREAKT